MARVLRFQATVPLKFWGEYVSTVVYLVNRLSSRVIGGKSPFEMFYLHALSLSHLRVFGCLYYATSPKEWDKFASRAVLGAFLGYSSTQKGYKICYLLSLKCTVFEPYDTPLTPVSFRSPPMDAFPTDFQPLEEPASLGSSSSAMETSVPESSHAPSMNLRRSSRPSKPHLWLEDYVTQPVISHTCKYPISSCVSYDAFKPAHLYALSSYSSITEPKSFRE
ncbi:uncharacterized protein LOC142162379 [Nicotiana tabacum]|uniref:Uncharacterized protein LOC142162379 n=1 Tax=Nicotiana tabacum TaxID=4097 RepID=A0AC58RQ34_TOBAC